MGLAHGSAGSFLSLMGDLGRHPRSNSVPRMASKARRRDRHIFKADFRKVAPWAVDLSKHRPAPLVAAGIPELIAERGAGRHGLVEASENLDGLRREQDAARHADESDIELWQIRVAQDVPQALGELRE